MIGSLAARPSRYRVVSRVTDRARSAEEYRRSAESKADRKSSGRATTTGHSASPPTAGSPLGMPIPPDRSPRSVTEGDQLPVGITHRVRFCGRLCVLWNPTRRWRVSAALQHPLGPYTLEDWLAMDRPVDGSRLELIY